MTKVAKSVSGLEELYSKKMVDWNFEYMRSGSKQETPYIIVLYGHEALAEAGKGEKTAADVVLGPDIDYGPKPDLSRTKKEDTVHWLNLLPFHISKMEVLKIEGLKLNGTKMEFHSFDLTDPEKAPKDSITLQNLLDYASTIYTYDADRLFSLLRRIQDDYALAGQVTPVAERRYIRQAPWFFGEGDMIHWRHRCRDIRSTFPNKSYNRDVSVDVLLANHVPNPDTDVDDRGGVYVAFQALCMTFIGGMEWFHVNLEC